MAFNNMQDFLDLGGKNILCKNIYVGFTGPDQVAYNTLLPPPLSGGAGGSPGGTNGQVQYNANGSFGGLANSALTALLQTFTSTTAGVVPQSGGGTTNFLRADGTWTLPPNSPGGTTQQVQINNNGAFGGITNTQLTANINVFTTSLSGAVPASPGGTTTFIRADGTWASPPQGAATQRSATSSSAAQPLSTDIIINLNVNTAFNLGLPQASTRNGKHLTLVDVGLQTGAHNITVIPFSGDTIVNWTTPSSLVMNSSGMSISLYPFNDGVNTGWFIA